MRSLATDEQLAGRKARQVPISELDGKEAWIDGFNTIITLEVMLSNGILFECLDGTIRDLAALRGTYRLIPETTEAVRVMLETFQKAGISKATILLDEPVSNSGRLKSLIAEIGEEFAFDLDIQILRDVDRSLYGRENVITTDSVIMDHCISWVNLAAECMKVRGTQISHIWKDKKMELVYFLAPGALTWLVAEILSGKKEERGHRAFMEFLRLNHKSYGIAGYGHSLSCWRQIT